jgi:hypothetical protein
MSGDIRAEPVKGPDLRVELESLRRRVENTEAILAIQALKSEYARLVDSRFSQGAVVARDALDEVVVQITSLFTPDAIWDGGPVLGKATGRQEIADRMRNPTLIFSRHLFSRPQITVDQRRATGHWELLCPCKTPDGRSWWMCGYEDDEYRADDGIWRHSKMTLSTVFMSGAGEGFERILV